MLRDPQKPWLLKPAITNIAGGPASSSSGAQAPPELVTTGQSTEYIAEMAEAEMRTPTPRDSDVEAPLVDGASHCRTCDLWLNGPAQWEITR